MQVSQTHDHINHAIIGGKSSIDFGISTSMEFFDLLSSGLYKDQILAVVREVMCNAWDAHIEAGCQDKPVEITINNEDFIVKDFGLGIHHEDIGPIYGVYGNSTKKNDGTQTGGFGLGCKSPFAYTDHFEVTSCNDGIKTIYRMSKSVVQNGGKPGIIPIGSFKTDETGLTVKINLKSIYDKSRFEELAKQIAFNGEMLVKINGIPQPKFGFNTTQHNFIIHRKELVSNSPTITVRYGNVIYPVDSCSELRKEYEDIRQFLGKLEINSWDRGYKITFQAPPHSLAITPSREALSMKEYTINTLRKLFQDFLDSAKQNFDRECDAFAEASIQTAVDKEAYAQLLSRDHRLPYLETGIGVNAPVLTDFKEMAKQHMSRHYPIDLAFRKVDWKCRITLMIEKKLIDRGLAHTWLQDVDKVKQVQDTYDYTNKDFGWLARRVIAPLWGKLTLAGLDPEKLYIIDDKDVHSRPGYITIPAKIVKSRHHFYTAAYLRNIVVLSRRKGEIYDRAIQHEMFTKFGKTTGFLFYHVGLKANDAVTARAFFAKTGMNVVDMIDRQEWEEDNTPVVKQVIRATRKKGIPKASCLLDHGVYSSELVYHSDNERIEKPEYVIRVFSGRSDKYRLGFLDHNDAIMFIKLFGERGAVVTSEKQYDSYYKKGAKSQEEFLTEEVVKYFTANKSELEKYWSCHFQRNTCKKVTLLDYAEQSLFKEIYSIPDLAKHYQINISLKPLSEMYVRLYDALRNWRSDIRQTAFAKLVKDMEKIPEDQNVLALLNKIKKSELCRMLNSEHISSAYHKVKNDPAKLQAFITSITTILDN